MADRKQAKRDARKPPPPRPVRLTAAWALGILTLLVVLFFNEVVVGGKTLLAPDAYEPAGFARIGGQSLFHDHVYPLWNPYVFLGMPSFASGTYNPLIYPPDWPLGLLQKVLPFLPELTWLLIYYVLGGFFTFLLAREWKARPEGALLGAAAFVFAPNLIAVGTHGHGSQLVDSAYIPLLLWLAARWMRTGSVPALGWLALAGGFQMLRGHVQICFYTWLAVGLYVVVEWIFGLRQREQLAARTLRAVGVAVAAALAFGIAGFYNLPLRDYAAHSIRGGSAGGAGMEFATQWSLAPYELPSIAIPAWVGFGGATYWGGMPFTDYANAYVGMVTVLLLLPAFLSDGPARIFALALGLVSLLIAFGKHFPLYGFLYDHLPLFNKFRVPVMIVVLFQVATSLGLAWGWSAVLEQREARAKPDPRLDRLLLGAGALVVVLVVMAQVGQEAWRGAYTASAVAHRAGPNQPYPAEAANLAFRALVVDALRVGLLGLLALAAAWLAQRRKLPAAVATGAVLLLLLGELWPVSGRVMLPVVGDAVRRDAEQGRDDAIEFLEKAGPPGTFRVLPIEEFQSNRYAAFGIASIGGYHAAKPRLYQDFFEARLVDNLGWLRLLNVRYVLSSQPIEPPLSYLRRAHGGTRFVYENLLALPRATVVGRYKVVSPPAAILDSVKLGTSESAEITFLDRDPGLRLGPVQGARAAIASYRMNEVVVDVETPGPALLRLADLWYPDWIATVDGHRVEILKADYLLRAVPVPAGRHRVVFRFESPAMRRGLLLSGASLIVVLLLIGAPFLLSRLRARAAGRPQPEAQGAA